MWKVLGNIIEMFVYSAVYVLIALIAFKVVGATLASDFERKISVDGNLALSVISSGLFIGLALLLAAVVP